MRIGKMRLDLTRKEKNIVLKLINGNFTESDSGKYVGVIIDCIARL